MALSAANETGRMHDSHYGPDLLGFQCSSSNPHMANASARSGRLSGSTGRFDDFSVSANLHVLRPQVLSLSPTPTFSVQRIVQSRTPNPAVFKRIESMPARLAAPEPMSTPESPRMQSTSAPGSPVL